MTYTPPASRPVPPPGTFVLRRDPAQDRVARWVIGRALVATPFAVVLYAAMLVWFSRDDVRDLFRGGPGDVAGLATVAIVIAGVVAGVWWWLTLVKARRVERGLAGLELWIGPEGPTYVCAAGTFHAPWTALRRMYFGFQAERWRHAQWFGERSAPALHVEVAGWGGPLAEYEKPDRPCDLRMPLPPGLGGDPATIARAVHEISSGRAWITQA